MGGAEASHSILGLSVSPVRIVSLMISAPPTVVAIVASHNRREKTLACMRSYFALVGDYELSMVLVDDGSSDGTAEAVSAFSDRIEVLRGDGSLFHAKAMAIAEQHAAARRPDYLLWLNDDVVLRQDALETLVAGMGGNVRRVVTGSVVDPVTGELTYGGLDRFDWHPLRMRHVGPTDGIPRPVSTISGNVVLVPKCVYLEVGGIDGGFSHGRADRDYGLRARRLGIESMVTGRPVGTCPQGVYGAWQDPTLPLREKTRLFFGRKGYAPMSMARYLRRHGGPGWPIYLATPLVRFTIHMTSTALASLLTRRERSARRPKSK